MSSAILPISESTCVIRATDRAKGRSRALAPGSSAVRWLHYGRIILDAGDAPVIFSNEDHETGLICLKGNPTVTADGQTFAMTQYDAVYIPRDSKIEVHAGRESGGGLRLDGADAGGDLAEISAPVDGRYPLKFVPFSEVRSDPGLHFKAGNPSSQRDLNILIGKNVEAGRIVAGVTFSEPGNWTSWPPHEHAELLEEAYLYIDMPKPAWGVQFVYTNPNEPELAAVVHEGDCVVMPQGYHPNVSAPGGSINFLWMMAAHRETTDRLFGVVNVQPEYATGGSGLERGQK